MSLLSFLEVSNNRMTIKNEEKRMSSKRWVLLAFYCWRGDGSVYMATTQAKIRANCSGREIDSVKAAYAERENVEKQGKSFVRRAFKMV